MTTVESLLRTGLRSLQSAFATTAGFTLSDATGSLGSFVGVIDEPVNSLELIAGGDLNSRGIRIDCDRSQFEDADTPVIPVAGMWVTYGGNKYVITRIPQQTASAYSYALECESVMSGRSR